MAPRTFQIEPGWGAEPPKWNQNGANVESDWRKYKKTSQCNKKVGGVPIRRPILARSGANMAPTWVPTWSQDAQTKTREIDPFFLKRGFLEGFWCAQKWIHVGTKMGSNIDVILEG